MFANYFFLRIVFLNLTIIILLTSISAFAENVLPRDRLDYLLKKESKKQTVNSSKKVFFVTYQDKDITSPNYGTELCALETSSNNRYLIVKDIEKEGSPKIVYGKSIPKSTFGVINGGFWGLAHNGKPVPLGIVKSEGEIKNKQYPWTSGGVIIATKDNIGIIPIRKLENYLSSLNIIQSKPLLVEAGNDGIRTATSEKFDRSAIAITQKGEIIFFVLHEPAGRAASLAEFSHILTKYRSVTNSSIEYALAMDGGPSAYLYIPSINKYCGSGVSGYIPNIVYIY